MKHVRLGKIHADCLTFRQAIDRIAEVISAGQGGFVVTPNVDHVVLAETDERLRLAYDQASVSLVDGMPLVWLSRLMGHPLPVKISGSDLVRPLMNRATSDGWRVYLFGAAPGVAEKARDVLCSENLELNIVECCSPSLNFEADKALRAQYLTRVRAAKPDLVMFALGCPKQELLMCDWKDELAPAVSVGVGATFDFVAGRVKRAPRWISRIGAEWVFRISQDPKRLAHRYLVRDREIFRITMRMLRLPKQERAYET